MKRMGKYSEAHELNCGACGYHTCREHALAIAKGFAESEMCLPFVIDTNLSTIRKLTQANEKLASAQETLMHSERLASMGQLAAGVAHEINNPLGVVLMYTHLLLDECSKELGPAPGPGDDRGAGQPVQAHRRRASWTSPGRTRWPSSPATSGR